MLLMLKGHQDDFSGDGHGDRFHTLVHHNHIQIQDRDGVDQPYGPRMGRL